MMKCRLLFLLMAFAAATYAAQIKDVRFACDAKGCRTVFVFASAKDLPTFYQKYDAAAKKLTVGFSESTFAPGAGEFDVDAESKFIKSVRVFKEAYKGTPFLKFEFSVGPSISTDKNEIALDKANFLIKFKSKGGKPWALSKLSANLPAAEAESKPAAVSAKDKKAAEKAAKEEKKRLAEEKKAAAKLALEEKKRLAAEKKAAEKAAREQEKLLAEQQKQLDKAISEGGKISALLPNLKEMTVLMGSGMEQFRLVAESPIDIRNISGPDNNSTITIGLAGPQKSPLFRIGAGSLVKSVTWGANGLKVQLKTAVKPVILVQEGVLILQVAENAIRKDGFIFWSARPDGIYIRDWMKAVEEKPDFNVFVNRFTKDSKKIISGSQTFHLRPVLRELIVVADEIEFYAAPNENAQVLQRLVFGDRLVSLDLTGLYRKVQYGNRVGYVNRRSVGFFDELTPVQIERLKQVDLDRGSNLTANSAAVTSQLEGLYEDKVTYSSFGRRDPFVEVKGLVEDGININQVELVGIIWESDVPMAILVDTKNPAISYTLKEDDKILNGKVLKITQTDVLFLIQEFGVSRRYTMGLPDKFGGQK